MVIWYDTEAGKITSYFANQITEESKENGELVAELIALALKEHKKLYPQHTEAALVTDGAGTYSGIELLSRLGYQERIGLTKLPAGPLRGVMQCDVMWCVVMYRVRKVCVCICMCDILLTCANYHDRVGCVDWVCK